MGPVERLILRIMEAEACRRTSPSRPRLPLAALAG